MVSGGQPQISVRHTDYVVKRPHLTPSDSGSRKDGSLETNDRFARAREKSRVIHIPPRGVVLLDSSI